jgi:sugar lactone lactonase YvrE
MVPSTPGGPKLVAVDLSTNQVIQTITFPPTTVIPGSTFLNDVRFDLRSNLTGTSGKGVAYITDASEEGTPGIIVVDIGTGTSWRKLENHPSVRADPQFVGIIDGKPLYEQTTFNSPKTFMETGSDGIAISADGNLLFYSPLCSRRLHAVPTELLRMQNGSEIAIEAAVQNRGQKVMSDGLETDSRGLIYTGMLEQVSCGGA